MVKEKSINASERKLNRLLAQLNKTEEELHQLLGNNFARVLANHPSAIPPLRSATRHEQRCHTLVKNALNLVSIMSADGTIIYQGPSAERVLGFRSGENQSENVYDLAHREKEQAFCLLFLLSPKLLSLFSVISSWKMR